MQARGRRVFRQARAAPGATARGTFVLPTLIELERIDELEREVFGPVLHLVRFQRRDLAAMVAQIDATGYGLTLGVQSRIDETIGEVVGSAHVGNVYVNRNMVGAVVGVQPFGGEGLSGTGPKAGGPLYLYRLLTRRPPGVMARALAAGRIEQADAVEPSSALAELQHWAERRGDDVLVRACSHFAAESRVGIACVLAGPTGERNVYTLYPREAVLCLAESDGDRLVQLAAVLAVGSRALWPSDAASLHGVLPPAVRTRIALVADWREPAARFDVVLHHGSAAELRDINARVAARPRADRRRRRRTPGRDGAAARSPGDRAGAQHQHRRRGRQRQPHDIAMKPLQWRSALLAALLASASCGARAETTVRRIEVGGHERTYSIDRPSQAGPERPLPVVIVFHGGGGSGASARTQTRLSEKGETEGFITVYPRRLRAASPASCARGMRAPAAAGRCSTASTRWPSSRPCSTTSGPRRRSTTRASTRRASRTAA